MFIKISQEFYFSNYPSIYSRALNMTPRHLHKSKSKPAKSEMELPRKFKVTH